jgi:hypothetical protein
MKAKGYDNTMFTLRNEAGAEVNKDDTLVEYGVVLYGEPPHKQGSSGYVTTTAGRFYAHVFGLRWVSDTERTTTINIDALAAMLADYCHADSGLIARKSQALHLSYELEQELQDKLSKILVRFPCAHS